MRFTQSLFAGAALIAAALAQVAITQGPPSDVEVGKTYTIKWTPADNTPTKLLLRKGPGNNLDTIGTLTESATSGSFDWTVDTALVNGKDYALEIQQGDQSNYWGPFAISGSTATATSSASSSATSTAASSSKSGSASTSTTKAPSSSATNASASSTISFSGNSTISSATLSRSVTGTGSASATPTGSSTKTGGSSVPTGAASIAGASPLALIFGAVAAMAYLN